MRAIVTFCVVSLVVAPAWAEEKEPFPARTTQMTHNMQHTHERAGTVKQFSKFAIGGIGSHEAGGYIGGGKLVHGEGKGPLDGTFGWDYVGLGRRPGRIFLGWFHDSPKQGEFLPRYNTEGPRVKDFVAAQPYKKAIREARTEHKSGGKEE
jgi:hypothetical protein